MSKIRICDEIYTPATRYLMNYANLLLNADYIIIKRLLEACSEVARLTVLLDSAREMELTHAGSYFQLLL